MTPRAPQAPPTAQDAVRAREIDLAWREANQWPGMTWPEGSRPEVWPQALEDRVQRIAQALASERERMATLLDALADATPESEAGYRAGVRDSAQAIRAHGETA